MSGKASPVTPNPSVEAYRLINGYQITQAIHVAVTLGLPDHLKDGPRTSDALAALAATIAARHAKAALTCRTRRFAIGATFLQVGDSCPWDRLVRH